MFGDTTFSWSWFFGLWLRRFYLFIWRYKRYFLQYLCVSAPPIEIKMFLYMLSWHSWFLCFHLYIWHGFGAASRRNQSELTKTRKDFMNRGQSTSGPRDALEDPLSISFHCLSLVICFAPHFSAASSQNRLWHPHSSHVCSSGHPHRLAGCLWVPGVCFLRWDCPWPIWTKCLPPATRWGGCWPGHFILM